MNHGHQLLKAVSYIYMYTYTTHIYVLYTYICIFVSIEKLLSSFSLPSSWTNQVPKKSCKVINLSAGTQKNVTQNTSNKYVLVK